MGVDVFPSSVVLYFPSEPCKIIDFSHINNFCISIEQLIDKQNIFLPQSQYFTLFFCFFLTEQKTTTTTITTTTTTAKPSKKEKINTYCISSNLQQRHNVVDPRRGALLRIKGLAYLLRIRGTSSTQGGAHSLQPSPGSASAVIGFNTACYTNQCETCFQTTTTPPLQSSNYAR